MIPFVDLKPVVDLVKAGAMDDFARILDDHEFVGRATVEKLETKLCEMLGVRAAVACSSGTSALELALRACGIKHGDLVAMPDVTFWATFEAIKNVGATPVLLDIDPDDLQLSYNALVAAVERRMGITACVLPHLFGWYSQYLSRFREYCQTRGIYLIEDAAQAFGCVSYSQEPIFTGCQIATLSFFPGKVIGGMQDSGAVLVGARGGVEPRVIASLRDHGRVPGQPHEHERVGTNARMGGLNAAYLLRMLAQSTNIIAGRVMALSNYRRRVKQFPGSNGYLAVMEVDEPENLARRLHEAGVETRRIYPHPISDHFGAANGSLQFGSVGTTYSNAARFCRRVLNLPLFYGITREQQDIVIKALEASL